VTVALSAEAVIGSLRCRRPKRDGYLPLRWYDFRMTAFRFGTLISTGYGIIDDPKIRSIPEELEAMTLTDEIAGELHAWAPELAESFASLAYLGSESAIKWITDSQWSSQLYALTRSDGHTTAASERVQL